MLDFGTFFMTMEQINFSFLVGLTKFWLQFLKLFGYNTAHSLATSVNHCPKKDLSAYNCFIHIFSSVMRVNSSSCG